LTAVQWRRHNSGPIGIDVGAQRVRAVQLGERAGGWAVTAAGSEALPAGAGRDPAALRSAVGKLLGAHPFTGKNVAVALPSQALQIKNLRLPRMPDEELFAAGEFEARERFQDLADAILRVVPAGLAGRAGDEQCEIIVLAARRDAVEAHLNLFTGMGLTVTALEPGPQAFFRPYTRFLERAADAEKANAFVDVGARGSCIMIARGSDLAFLKMCPVGGETFDRAVAEALNVPRDQAAGLRRRVLAADGAADPQAEAVQAAVGPAVDQLGKEVGLCLRYYAVTFRGERPEQLTAGGSEMAYSGISERLAAATQLSVRVGDALRGVTADGVFTAEEMARGLPEWTVAIGLALGGRQRAGKELQVA